RNRGQASSVAVPAGFAVARRLVGPERARPSERQTKRTQVVSGDRLELGLFGRLKRTAIGPAVFARRDDPELTRPIAHDPVFGAAAVHKQGCHAARCCNQFLSLLGSRWTVAI